LKLLDLDIWHASASHVDVLLPSLEIRDRFMSSLPPRYGQQAEIIIPDFLALYDGRVEPVVEEDAEDEDASDDDDDTWLKPKHPRKGRKHRKRPAPAPPAPEPPHVPPPPPPGSNRTTPDTYNTTDLSTAFHDAYHPLSVIYDFMDELAVTYTGAVEVVTLGMSAEGREIKGIKIHKSKEAQKEVAQETGRRVRGKGRKKAAMASDGEEQVQEIYIQGGQHAREVRPLPQQNPFLLIILFGSGYLPRQSFTLRTTSSCLPSSKTTPTPSTWWIDMNLRWCRRSIRTDMSTCVPGFFWLVGCADLLG
jgi:hypothetical protein